MYSKGLSILLLFSLVTLVSCNGQKNKSDLKLKSTADSVAYAIGATIGGNMKKDGLDSLNLDILKKGMMAAIAGDSLVINTNESQGVIQAYLQQKQKEKSDANYAAGKKFLQDNKKKAGVIELPSGLQYMVIKDGTGPTPGPTDTVYVHYKGTFINGEEFDSDRGQQAEFYMDKLIPGMTEALMMMKPGSKWKLFVPPVLGYGERPYGSRIPANSTLLFDLELISIKGK